MATVQARATELQPHVIETLRGRDAATSGELAQELNKPWADVQEACWQLHDAGSLSFELGNRWRLHELPREAPPSYADLHGRPEDEF